MLPTKFAPDWFINLMVGLMLIGAITVLVLIGALLNWLANHVVIV